ncbi:MAG: hypothetical protein ABII96_10700, partial [Candidatus Zixiibacteriota bacterium]
LNEISVAKASCLGGNALNGRLKNPMSRAKCPALWMINDYHPLGVGISYGSPHPTPKFDLSTHPANHASIST